MNTPTVFSKCAIPKPAIVNPPIYKRCLFCLLMGNALFPAQPVLASQVCAVYTAGAACTTSADLGTVVRQQTQTLQINPIDSASANVFVRQQDYKHPQSRLSFVRYYNSVLADHSGSMGFGWRSSYSVSLQKLPGQALLLTQADGRKSVFKPKSNAEVFHSDQAEEGTIQREDRYWNWTTAQGNSVRFLGPFPVRYSFNDKTSLDLFYRDNQLRKVTDNLGNTIILDYDGDNTERLLGITLPGQKEILYHYNNGQLIEAERPNQAANRYRYDESNINSTASGINSLQLSTTAPAWQSLNSTREKRVLQQLLMPDADHCSTSSTGGASDNGLQTGVNIEDAEDEQQCNQENSSAQQNQKPLVPGAVFREIFATDCLSYFDAYSGTGRGFRIESAFMQHESFAQAQVTATRFPVLDFLDNRVAVAVVSRDLRSPSYTGSSSESALYYKLMADALHMYDTFLNPINTHQQISATQGGLTTTVHRSDFDTFVFELVLQRGAATPAHIAQINRAAAAMLKLYGIKLQVVEIP